MLALNKKVGLLSIQSAKMWKVLYFDQRGVTVHHNVHRVLDRVVAAFVRSGRLQPAAVDEVREHAARMGQPLADSLLAGGYLEARSWRTSTGANSRRRSTTSSSAATPSSSSMKASPRSKGATARSTSASSATATA
jgi:hypothetical protein